MNHSRLRDSNALIEFLNQNGIPAIPPTNANPGMLHWWEFEKVERITDVAIFDGYFFLAVTEQGFSLHVFNGESDWYNYVRVWNADVSEADFLQDLKSIIFSDDVYSFNSNSYVWSCMRETYFDFEWQRTISDIQSIEQISPELKLNIFKAGESVVGNSPLKQRKQAVIDLLELFTRESIRNTINGLIMQRYFPPSKYERWKLPAEFKSLLREIGEAFGGSSIPTANELGTLIQKVKDLSD